MLGTITVHDTYYTITGHELCWYYEI